MAGKFRRYHGESWLRQILDIKTVLLNIRDLFLFGLGTLQALVMLPIIRPDVILLKGGFVGVPVGLAAAFWRIPFVTHDSDAMPGLANRLVARWARVHATGMPASFYRYPEKSVRHVGVLVSVHHQPVTEALQREYKQEIDIPVDAKLLFVTGGSLGAVRLNQAMAAVAPRLLRTLPDLHIVHQVGKGNERTYGTQDEPRLHVLPFVKGMYRYSGAADLIVTRAGANTLAEFGVQGKPIVVVPNPQLTGGHQIKNAEYLAEQGAAVVINETDLQDDNLFKVLNNLLTDPKKAAVYGKKLQEITIPDAAHKLAQTLIDVADVSKKA